MVKLQNQGHFWNLHWIGCRKMSSYCFHDLFGVEKSRLKKRKQFCWTPCSFITEWKSFVFDWISSCPSCYYWRSANFWPILSRQFPLIGVADDFTFKSWDHQEIAVKEEALRRNKLGQAHFLSSLLKLV